MTETNPDQGNQPMSLWQKWKRVSLPNKFAIVTSIIAIIWTFVGFMITIHYSEKQALLDSSVATFQVQVQTTADYQYNQQLFVQQTQIALQSQMDAWARQQALPFVSVVVPPEHIFVVENVFAEQNSSGYVITGEGVLEIVLANNGGAKAGIVNIDWINEAQNNTVLHSYLTSMGNSPAELPGTIDAQTPVRVQLALEASVPYADDPTGKSDYQLGTYWRQQLVSGPNHLSIRFSNTDPIELKIKDIQLAMPVTAFQPSPTSLFVVTNKTLLTVRCFKTGGKDLPIKITYLKQNLEVQTTVSDETCNSFPVGQYRIILSSNSSNTDQLTVTFTSDGTSTIDLTKPNSNLFDEQFANIINGLAWVGFLSATIFSFFSTVDKGFVELYLIKGNASSPLWKRFIRLKRWGVTIRPRILEAREQNLTLKIHKQSKDLYILKIYRNSGWAQEVTLRDGESFIIGSTPNGELEIKLRDFGNKVKESREDG